MPSQRAKGKKLAGAYIPEDQDRALERQAADLGYANKADYIRALFEEALRKAVPAPAPKKRAAKKD